MPNLLRMRLPLFLGLLLAACSNSNDSAVPLFSGYGLASASLPRLLPIADLDPGTVSPLVTGFSVAPALPAGLSLDPGTGVISGAPTALSAAQDYTITAVAGAATLEATLNLEVREPLVSLGASRALIRTVPVTVVTVGPGGTAPIASFPPAPTDADGVTSLSNPAPATAALVDLEDVPGNSSQTPPGLVDSTSDFQTFLSLDTSELSSDPWQLSCQPPYQALTPAGPSFLLDTQAVPLVDGELTVKYQLQTPAVGPLLTGSIPTLRLERRTLTNPLLAGADPGPWFVAGGVLYGTLEDFQGNDKLYAFDPSIPSLTQVTNTCGSTVNEAPVVLGSFGNRLAISVLNNAIDQDRELFFYEGAGPVLLRPADTRLNGSDEPGEVEEYLSMLYFSALFNATDRGLFRYIPGSPALVQRIGNTSGGGNDDPRELTNFDNQLFFTALSGGVRSLFRFNTATNTLERVSQAANGDVRELTVSGGVLYAVAETAAGGSKLFRYAGGNSLVQIVDFRADPALDDAPEDLFVYSDDVFFTALRPLTALRKLHRFQPLAQPLRAELLSNVAGNNNDDQLSGFTVAGTEVCFRGNNPSGVAKLWSFNDATAEVRQLVELRGAALSDDPAQLTAFGDRLAVVMSTAAGGRKLFVYDPASRGVVQVLNSTGAAGDDRVSIRAAIGSVLYFTADDGSGNLRLYSLQ
jgi:hypothetical protein